MPKIEVWIGNNPIGDPSSAVAAEDPSARGGDFVDTAAERLKAVGPCIASLFTAMRLSDSVFASETGVEQFEIEIGFALEIGAGGGLQLILSPKAGVTYKAKATWRRGDHGA